MNNSETNHSTSFEKKNWKKPEIYVLGTGSIHGGANNDLHENRFHSSKDQFGHHYIITKTAKGGLNGHQVPGTHLNYYS